MLKLREFPDETSFRVRHARKAAPFYLLLSYLRNIFTYALILLLTSDFTTGPIQLIGAPHFGVDYRLEQWLICGKIKTQLPGKQS